MKRIIVFLLIGFGLAGICGAQTESVEYGIFRQEGIASWYGKEFAGRPTASGEIFNPGQLTAAHPVLPFGTMLKVTNKHNNRSVTVRVNDRGPFVSARIIDVSQAAAEQLDMVATGTAPVQVESISQIALQGTGKEAAPWRDLPSKDEILPLPEPPAFAAYDDELGGPVMDPLDDNPRNDTVAAQKPLLPRAQVDAAEDFVQVFPASPPIARLTARPAEQPAAPAKTPVARPVQTVRPAAVQTAQPYPLPPATIRPGIPQAGNGKHYRIQVGSYKVARNAADAFEKLKKAGLSPSYERNGEYYRVVLAGVPANEVEAIAGKLGSAGFREALIRTED
ncbi:MAG: septal ring lytic transglycosylase RlpA family protein [Treponema sp.]|nr:septal ring lytic transglycosylase RlpA family protein [Treponema sp.]